ncbi:HLGFF motif protein [Neisseria weaveri]|uniref:Uncharacterized protein n=1 Tax=Neisseria weaveri TaxID=28091 RepID=A0A448VQJ3_9NEIS|nr:hypothetical protein [Neisseria weaveri]EGV34707.1 hypothetical protein l13_19660 [Neisseria weaveri ATCC 51223]EGV35791.1 hypothetical protein l11_19410 [Neisseria weaveri LMG 5135]SAY50638.1 Uncharacterised protein [Neisseria weaveri]VEJ52050.1 Uncharacterised protein [Neisseria weaveri]
MHYFSIHTLAGEHLGFLVMMADNEHENPPGSGYLTVKLQSEQAPKDEAAAQAVHACETVDSPLTWLLEKNGIALYGGTEPIGRIRNEYLTLHGQTLVLNDLTGMM